MIKNYLKIILVNLKKYKAYSFINILGLALGIACSILIAAYVFHELNFDKFHENTERIYRLRSDLKMAGDHLDIPKSGPPMGEYLVQNYPEVLDAVRFRSLGRVSVRYRENQFYEDRLFFTDNSVFNIFTFPLVEGDPRTALEAAFSMVITEDMAKKYFGAEDPVGKVLTVNNQYNFTVTGVAQNVPSNSHFIFDMLCSFETYAQENKSDMQNWLSINNYTYILLREGYDYRQLEQKLPDMVQKKAGAILKYANGELKISLQPLVRIHLHSNLMQEIGGNSDIVYVYIFAAVAIFILAIACINFMNLSTARSANRAQEVGLRKVMGADRGKIIRQFLGESVFYGMISLVFALFLVELALPLFRSLSGMQLRIPYTENPWLILSLIGLAVLVGICAGSYPAFFLSAFQPVRVLKGQYKAGTGSSRFRSVLVIVQFAISAALIIGTIVVFNQLKYMKNARLGFHKEQVVVVPISDESTQDSLRPLKEELKSLGGILSVAASSQVPGQTVFFNPKNPEGFSMEQLQFMGELAVDADFFPTLGIEMAAGRNFSPELETDIGQSIIINETAAKKFGWENPLGKSIKEFTASGKLIKKTVIGVVKDFHIESLHKQIAPLHISCTNNFLNSISIRISPGNIPETMARIQEKMKQFAPHQPFAYTFLDDSFDSQYRAEERLSRIFTYFSMLAVFIACLGLFGLASFTAEQRTKEIGIRKVLGASVSGILVLLSKEFTKWVLIANVIAWPLSYYFLNKWLQGFAYRTNITVSIFVLSLVISLLIALLTVSFQALRAATADPIRSLRYE